MILQFEGQWDNLTNYGQKSVSKDNHGQNISKWGKNQAKFDESRKAYVLFHNFVTVSAKNSISEDIGH